MNEDVSVPDSADWTWVLTRQCPQCGVDVGTFELADLVHTAREYVRRFRHLFESDPDVGQRPAPDVWSPREYGAHLRDVCTVFRSRIKAMLLHEQPSYPDWDQNAAALEGGYGAADPLEVADELATAAGDLLRDAEALTPAELRRTGVRSDGFMFTVETLLQYYLHELVHHWWDVSGQKYE